MFFLLTFFLTYITLTFLYQEYLNSFGENKLDGITQFVGENTKHVMHLFDKSATIEESLLEPYIKLFYSHKYVARIIEGCNAISVIILFVAFIVAFSGKIKPTLVFIFGGSILIYVLNIFRIAILCVLMFNYPNQKQFFHSVLFPLFIYGVVFILWVIWVNKFSRYASKTTKE